MKEIHCNDCRHWGSKGCPSSEKCYALADKPYFERKKRKEGFFRRIRGRLADKLERYIERKCEEIENEPCEMSEEEIIKLIEKEKLWKYKDVPNLFKPSCGLKIKVAIEIFKRKIKT